jgi:transcriptional regulator of acetoin/glycerol metabolism
MLHNRAMKQPPRVTEEVLRQALNQSGSPEKAAPFLGVSRRTVYRWMEHYGIRRQSEFANAA